MLFFLTHKQTNKFHYIIHGSIKNIIARHLTVNDFILNIYSLFSQFTVMMYFDFYTDRFILNCLFLIAFGETVHFLFEFIQSVHVGITMPKALFFENALITRKPSVEVEGLQKVIPKNIPEI